MKLSKASRPILRLALIAALCLAPPPLLAQRFLPDDPLWKDPDQQPIPKPSRTRYSQVANFLLNTFHWRPRGEIVPAVNVNTLGKVADSSWFTNRMGRNPMSVEELIRGPNRSDGPRRPFRIISVKDEGRSPGFWIRDSRDDVYIMKFDPLGHYQLATSTEVVATKFFHAFGYNVPENYLTHFYPHDLQISPQAKVTEFGRLRPFSEEDLASLLLRLPRGPGGELQAMASKFLEGTPIGPFRFYGTRSDDPNDIFRHEDRRELRGLRVFSAWLNHDDLRAMNTLDMYIETEEGGYIRHNLLDFGSCLGSGTTGPQNPRAGSEFMLEWKPVVKSALTLGLWDQPWRRVAYPSDPAVGNFEAEFFHPPEWKTEYPVPALDRMLLEDAFWAARIVFDFSDEMVRATVGTGQYLNPATEDYLARTLIQRRDKILRYYFDELNPLDDFRIDADTGRLEFRNFGIAAGLSQKASYRYQWYEFDNQSETTVSFGSNSTASLASIPLPDRKAAYWMVSISTESPERQNWRLPVRVYIRSQDLKVVGLKRETPE